MVKTKILSKQKKSSENTPKYKLKTGVKLIPYSPTQEILKGDLTAKAIMECLLNNDLEGVIEVISEYLEILHKVKTSEHIEFVAHSKMKIKQPTMTTLAKFMNALTFDDSQKVSSRK